MEKRNRPIPFAEHMKKQISDLEKELKEAKSNKEENKVKYLSELIERRKNHLDRIEERLKSK